MPHVSTCGRLGNPMAELVSDKEFLEEWARVRSEAASKRIERMLELIASMPDVGSAITADSLRVAYGNNLLKALVDPYQIIYEYDRSQNTVFVYGLLYSPTVR